MQQLQRRPWHRAAWIRLLLVLAWMAAALALPVTGVRACSCGMTDLRQAVVDARLAFVGTVIDHRQTRDTTIFGGTVVEYAFQVERATVPTPEVTVVRAGGDEAGCGIAFAEGDEWLVIVPRDEVDRMGDTHLCAGNTRIDWMQAEQIAAVEPLLSVPPTPVPVQEASEPSPVTMVIVVVAGIVLAAGAGLVLRRSPSPRA